MQVNKLLFSLVLLFTLSPQWATATEFSATATMKYPQGQTAEAKMYVGKDGVRREYSTPQGEVIEIILPSQGKRYMLMPQQKTYQVSSGKPMQTGLGMRKPTSTNPCTGTKGQQCKLLGQEKVGNRLADKWEVVRESQGRKLRVLMWIDVERFQALRQFFPDGSTAELLMLGKEKVDGRQTEKWVLQMTRPDGQSEKTFQWYDPELGIIIKEMMTGGYVRELTDIKVGSQPVKLFSLPSGYRKVEKQQAH